MIILAGHHEDGVELVLPKSQLDLMEKLRLYAIGRKVSLSDPLPVSGSWLGQPGDTRLGERGQRSLQVGLDAVANPAAELDWRLADLCEPLPWLPPEQSARHLPQFLGLEANDGLSYRKGCFPGQEVIARVHYLGTVKRHLLGFELDGALGPPRHRVTRLESGRTGAHGDVLEQIVLGDRILGLAVCPIEWEAGSAVHCADEGNALNGRVVTPERLCYYLDNNNHKCGINQ